MSQTVIDVSAYPVSQATVRHLERPLFGHVIEGAYPPIKAASGSTRVPA